MDDAQRAALRPLRLNRPGNQVGGPSPVLRVPDRVSAHVMAPDRGSRPQTQSATHTRSALRQALDDLKDALDSEFAHYSSCPGTPCSCGLTGMKQYLGLDR